VKTKFCFFLSIYSRCGARWLLGLHDTLPCVLIAGTNQTLSSLSIRYWIIAAREEILEWEKECAVCKRKKAQCVKQIMALLPLCRLQSSLRAFTQTALDFTRPFIMIQGRGMQRCKRYLCLFTCLASRAVHMEMAYGLDTDSFLKSF